MAAECSICYEIFGKENKEVVVTKCGHMFHHDCLNDWMKESSSCPHCRVATRRNGWRKVFLNCARNVGYDTPFVQSIIDVRDQLLRENKRLRRQLANETQRNVEELDNLRSQINRLKNRVEQNKLDHNGNVNQTKMMTRKQPNVQRQINPLYAHVQSKVATVWKNK